MYKKLFAILFLILFTISGNTQTTKVAIKSDGMKESNYLQMDDFYLTHHLYIDLFLRENLFVEANKEDVSAILRAIKKYVSEENPLELEIEKSGKINYKIRVVIFKTDDKPELLVVFTNWSVKKRKFEKEITLENDSYTRWYFLNDTKMTYRKDMSEENNYALLDKIDLANAYLFDELTDNDIQIKEIIEEILKKDSLKAEKRIKANLILLKYYIFKRETEKIRSQVDHLKREFANNILQDLSGLEMAFKATEFQIKLMQ